MNSIVPWDSAQAVVVADNVQDPGEIAQRALQLRPTERNQVEMNLRVGNYEIASVFVWTRTMALLKKQLGTLGHSFIGELLQRPDIDEGTDLSSAISETEAISLARDLGVFSPLQTKRLLNSQAIVNHFASGEIEAGDDETMTPEEAVSCLKVCVQGVLGHQRIEAAEDFRAFRAKLEAETLNPNSPEIFRLDAAPYFFVRTAISILLSIFRTAKGAQIEHASRNALLVIPRYWAQLKEPEKWQVGQAYAVEFSEGRREAVKALHSVLVEVNGFDFVPENLRSSTFIRVASNVIAAHQGLNNFYNEPAPMKELAHLGTSIPNPALAQCMTAALCVRLGNPYGRSHAAQPFAEKILTGLSTDRWVYYLDGRLDQDLYVLPKLMNDRPVNEWISLVATLPVQAGDIRNRDIRQLITDSKAGQAQKVKFAAGRLYQKAVGL